MSKEIKTIKDLQEQLDTYESNLWKNNQETLRSSNRTNGFLIKKRLTKASKLTFSTKF